MVIKVDEVKCRICGEKVTYIFEQTVLNKYEVKYYQCRQCDLIQTEKPYWLEEAYGEAISSLDTGIIKRNELDRNLTIRLFELLGLDNPSCVDFGGGHGVYTRMMRDAGISFYWHDKHASNLFSKGFEADLTNKIDVVTSFEVFEHLNYVKEEITEIFSLGADFVFISTVLHHGHKKSWAYYLPETGQHISFFSPKTIKFIAQLFDMDVIAGPDHSLFYRNTLGISPKMKRSIQKLLGLQNIPTPFIERMMDNFIPSGFKYNKIHRESLTWSDHLMFAEKFKRQ